MRLTVRKNTLYLILVVLLVVSYLNPVVSVLFYISVPGYLIADLVGASEVNSRHKIVRAVGLSVLFLIFIGLGVNYILPHLYIYPPLVEQNIVAIVNVLVILTIATSYYKNRKLKEIEIVTTGYSILDLVCVSFSISFPILAVLGALSLNNQVSNPYTILMLACIGMWGIFISANINKINSNVLSAVLFFTSLGLLMMTSMRGWYTTGHDNQLEFFVFQIAKTNAVWDIESYRDPYNASLSITILPTVISYLTKVQDVYVYKIVVQIIASFTVIGIFIFLEKYAGKLIAFLSVLIYMSFPTFINDLPMLNRQEIAMLFFSLLLVELFYTNSKKRIDKLFLYFFGAGMVLSHYSTTYIAIALFILVIILRLFLRLNLLNTTRLIGLKIKKPRIEFFFVGSLLAFTLFWNVQLTSTTTGLNRVVSDTYRNIEKAFSTDLKSGGVLYSFFSWGNLNKEEILADYVTATIDKSRRLPHSHDRYPEEIYSTHVIEQVDDYISTPKLIGELFLDNGISPFSFNFVVRQVIARGMQVFILIGLFLIFVHKNKLMLKFDTEYFLLVTSALFILGLFIFLPILSIEYGTQRLFQQLLTITALPMVLGTIYIFKRSTTIMVIVLVFLSLSGFLPYILGDYYPQLNLENAGQYYDSYYTHRSEMLSLSWMKENYVSRYDIFSSPSAHSKLKAVSKLFSYKFLLPGAVTNNAYVYFDYTNTTKEKQVVSYKGDLFSYKYPVEFLEKNKDLIYNNAETKVFK